MDAVQYGRRQYFVNGSYVLGEPVEDSSCKRRIGEFREISSRERGGFVAPGVFALPDEFVLKKYISALAIASNMLLCSLVDACIKNDTNTAVRTTMAATKTTFRTV